MGEILANGISPRDLGAFLNTSTGSEFLDSSTNIIALSVDSVCFVPAGKLVTFLCGGPPEVELPDLVWAFAVPIVKAQMLKALPEQVRASILKYNCEHYVNAEPRKMWAALEEALKTIIS